MTLIRKLLRKRTYVKPLDNALFSSVWLVQYQRNAIQQFFDDRRRYGWRVAVYNLRETLR
ncbi:MAG: hypothetical protein K8L99_12415 [Anaerolineae bacterium]|nr:hypothetical protein [Anaerolineae bacterium]